FNTKVSSEVRMISVPPASQLATNTRVASFAAAICRRNLACAAAEEFSSQNGTTGTSGFVPTNCEFTNTLCKVVIVFCTVLLGTPITLTWVVMHGAVSRGAPANWEQVVVLIM